MAQERERRAREGVHWTSIAAFVISILGVGYGVYNAIRGPQIEALAMKNVIIFAYPEGSRSPGSLGAVAMPELANTAALYPEIVLSQVIHVLDGETENACLSARGRVRFRAPDEPAQAPVRVEVHETDQAAEEIPLLALPLEVLDVSPRAELGAGRILSIRQLYDQLATNSPVDPCHGATKGFAVADLIERFAGKDVHMRYEASLAESGAFFISCRFKLTPERAERLRTRGWINAPCESAQTGQPLESRSFAARAERFFRRVF